MAAYMQWLNGYFLRKRLAFPSLARAAVQGLKYFMLELPDIGDDPRIAKYLVLRLVELLPRELQESLAADQDFMRVFGDSQASVVGVGPLKFEEEAYWKAAASAVNGVRAELSSFDDHTTVAFEPRPSAPGGASFRIVAPGTAQAGVVANEDLALLLESPSERESALNERREQFDCSKGEFSRLVTRIASMNEPRERVQEAERWVGSSYSTYLQELWNKLDKGGFKPEDLLPTDAEGILRYVRLRARPAQGADFVSEFEKGTEVLLGDEEPAVARERLIALPCPLPDSAFGLMRGLAAGIRREVLKKLLRLPTTPVSVAHLIRLLLEFQDDNASYLKCARRLARNALGSDGLDRSRALHALLRWVNDLFGNWQPARSWSPSYRLAMVWLHAHRVLVSFLGRGAPASWLADHFEQDQHHLPWEMFEREEAYWRDAAHARRVSAKCIALVSLGDSFRRFPDAVNDSIREAAQPLAFFEASGQQLPNYELCYGQLGTTDSLGSFFGPGRAERISSLLIPAQSSTFDEASLEAGLRGTVDILTKKRDAAAAWVSIRFVLGDLPIFDWMSAPLGKAARETDFVRLCEQDATSGLAAFHAACSVAAQSGDTELVVRTKNETVRIAALFASDTEGHLIANTDEAIGVVLTELAECTLILARADKDSASISSVFSEEMCRVVRAWPSSASLLRSMGEWFYADLPPAQRPGILKLVALLRAHAN